MKLQISVLFGLLMLACPLQAQDDPGTLEEVLAMAPDTNKVNAWISLSKSNMQVNLENGSAYGDSALQLARRLDFERGIALAHRQLGVAAYYGTRLEDALQHYNLTLEYYRKYGNRMEEAKMLTNIGLVKRNQGDRDKSMEYFFQALEIKEEIGDSISLAATLNNIGENFAIMGNAEEAERYFLQALAIYNVSGNPLQLHSLKLNLAGFYREQSQPDKSLPLLDEVLPYFKENGPLRELGRAYYILAGLHRELGEFKESDNAFIESQRIFDTLGFQMRSIGCIASRAEMAEEQGLYAQAIALSEEVLRRAEGLGVINQELRAYYVLSESYRYSGNYQKAFENLLICEDLRDSIINEETNKTVAELEEKYQSEVRERELAELAAVNQMNELTLRRQHNQQIALLVFALLILVISALLFNQYRQKKRTSDILLEKNNIIQKSLEEKEVLLKEIHHRVKNNLQFIASMFNIQTRFASDPDALRVLNENKDRINSMALLHQKLYQEDNLTGVDMESYIANLTEALIHSCGIDTDRIGMDLQVDELRLDVDTAIPIGLILNECITNAFKHAFKDRNEGGLQVILSDRQDYLYLLVADDGKGMPENFDPEKSRQFGFELIRSLAAKLKAELSIESDAGTRIELKIRKFQKT